MTQQHKAQQSRLHFLPPLGWVDLHAPCMTVQCQQSHTQQPAGKHGLIQGLPRHTRLTLLVLNLLLDILNSVTGLHLKGDGLAREGLDEDLHPAEGSCGKAGSAADVPATRITATRQQR